MMMTRAGRVWVAVAVAGIVLTSSAPVLPAGFLKALAPFRAERPHVQKRTDTATPLRRGVMRGASDKRADVAPAVPGAR
jgi:hypothetical protein